MIRILRLVSPFTARAVRKQAISITPTALSRLKQIFSQRKNTDDIGVKISLNRRGCNGLTYTMNYVQKPEKLDQVVQRDGLQIILDSKALMAIIGTQLDFVQTDISSQFVFNNPNQKGRCGCGQSFHL